MANEKLQFIDKPGIRTLGTELLNKTNERIIDRIVNSVDQNSTNNRMPTAKTVYDINTNLHNEDVNLINRANDNEDTLSTQGNKITAITNIQTTQDGKLNTIDTNLINLTKAVDDLTHLTIQIVEGPITSVTTPSNEVLYFQRDNVSDDMWMLYIHDGTDWINVGDTSIDLTKYWAKNEVADMKEALAIHNATSIPTANISTIITNKYNLTDPSNPVSIILKTPPSKSEYVEGENFDPAGMSVEVTYRDNTKEIRTTGFTTTNGISMTGDMTSIDVTYTQGISQTFNIPIKVYIPFTVLPTNREKIGYTGEENENLVIPATFTDIDGKNYKVISIGLEAFNKCNNLINVTIPDSVTSIGGRAFGSCNKLATINIPAAVTKISSYTFYQCFNLANLTIPDTVTIIENYSFSVVPHITYHGSATGAPWNAKTMNEVSYSADNKLILSIDGKTVLSYNGYLCDENVTIPDGVTTIDYRSFYQCDQLTSINIPDSVTTIGRYSFAYCDNLTTVNMPNTITSIEDHAFIDCKLLTNMNIPDSITAIGTQAFYGCISLTSINIPNKLTFIDNYVFYRCSSVTNVTIPNSVTIIGNDAFSGCSGLTSLTIPNSVTSIGMYSFAYCSNLTNVIIPDSVTIIKDWAFYSVQHITYNGTAIGRPWGALAMN